MSTYFWECSIRHFETKAVEDTIWAKKESSAQFRQRNARQKVISYEKHLQKGHISSWKSEVHLINIWSQIQAFCYSISGYELAGTDYTLKILSFDQILQKFYFSDAYEWLQSFRSLPGFRSGFKDPNESGSNSKLTVISWCGNWIETKLLTNPDPPFLYVLVSAVIADLKKIKLLKIVMTQKVGTESSTRFLNIISWLTKDC